MEDLKSGSPEEDIFCAWLREHICSTWSWVEIIVIQSFSHVQLCNPMDCSRSDFPVLHYLPKFVQSHDLWIDDAIQPYHPLSSSSPPALNFSQHQGFFQWVGSSSQVDKASASASVLPMNIQGWFPLGLAGFIFLAVQGTLKSPKASTVQKNEFFGTQPSLWSNSHICTWLLEKP